MTNDPLGFPSSAEGIPAWKVAGTWPYGGIGWEERIMTPEEACDPISPSPGRWFSGRIAFLRHHEGSNFGFLDGHAKYIRNGCSTTLDPNLWGPPDFFMRGFNPDSNEFN